MLHKNYQIRPVTFVILLVSAIVLFSSGCNAVTKEENLTEETSAAVATTAPSESTLPEPGPSEEPVITSSPGKVSFSATPEIKELEDSNWISPGKVTVENLHPGATAEYPLTIHNGGDATTEFSISVRAPDNTSEGYEPFPEMYFEWVTVTTPELELEAKQTADVLIIVDMPEDADYPGKNAEFWISVIDLGQSGMVRTELVCRWFVSTK